MGERRKTLNIWLKRTRDRDGVEGTRLEATDKKISEAKDSPFEDRPVLGQGHRRKCSQKKIMFLKTFFSRVLKKTKSKNLQKTSFSTKNDLQNFKDSKNTALLESRTGQFSRTWSFEAKDFKMCPRGLHLCKRNVSVALKNSWKLKTKCTLQNIVIRSFHRVTLR